jgi:hypothetical protein
VDPVLVGVGLFRIAGSLLPLRWPFWGGVAAIACDLLDLLLFDLALRAGWAGFDGYQRWDKLVDQVYLGVFLYVALRDFGPGPRLVAVALWLARLAAFVGFETGLLPREALFVLPNLFEPWYLAVAFQRRYRPSFRWTVGRGVVVLAGLLALKLVQEWALHVARLFDSLTFLGALEAIWRALATPFR